MTTLSIQHLSKSFGDVRAVDDLSFDVAAGAITGFVGPNGAGKTTTMRMMLGLVRPDAGTALFDGRPYAELTNPCTLVGAVLEATSFHPDRTGLDHLRLHARVIDAAEARCHELLAEVGLAGAARRPVRGYSLGMRQRLGLATALLGSPSVLVLDEPTNGLDPEGVHWLRGLLRAQADGGATVLVSSHLLAELAMAADAVVIVKQGRLVTTGTVAEITGRLAGGVHIRTPDAARLAAVLTERGISARTTSPDEVLAPDASTEAIGTVIAQTGIVVYEMRRAALDLEDAFLTLTAQEGER